MRKRLWGSGASAAVAAGIALTAVFATSGTATATNTLPIDETCMVNQPLTGDPFTISTSFDGTAPVSATTNSVITGTGRALPWTVPSDLNNVAVQEVRDYAVTLTVSDNASVLNATLSGGSNLGTGTPSITRAGNKVTLHVPGPLAPGSIVQLPAINFTIKTGAAGTVTTSLTGTSYTDPGVSVTGVMDQGDTPLVAPASCYAPAGGALTSTLVH